MDCHKADGHKRHVTLHYRITFRRITLLCTDGFGNSLPNVLIEKTLNSIPKINTSFD